MTVEEVPVSLAARRGYNPDLVSIACGKVAAARECTGLPVAAFAAALGSVLGWSPAPDLVRAWETSVAPPGHVVVACELLAARTARGPYASRSGPPPVTVDTSAPGQDGVTADAAAMRAFRSADLRVGGGHLYATVLQYLKTQVAPRLVLAEPVNGERVVFTSAAAVSEMAGWMAHDAGHDQVAGQHFGPARLTLCP